MNQLVPQLPTLSNEVLEGVLIRGNLSLLSASEKLSYINKLCESLGLNPLTRPFEYITFQGKEVLYARKDCCDQLRKIYKVSIVKVEVTFENNCYVAKAYAEFNGRIDFDMGIVPCVNARTGEFLVGADLANAQMKAVTKAKRRVTLSICGLGLLDECEFDTMPQVKIAEREPTTGELLEKLAMSETMEELRVNFMAAVHHAKKYGHEDTATLFIKVKDKRKEELNNNIPAHIPTMTFKELEHELGAPNEGV